MEHFQGARSAPEGALVNAALAARLKE